MCLPGVGGRGSWPWSGRGRPWGGGVGRGTASPAVCRKVLPLKLPRRAGKPAPSFLPPSLSPSLPAPSPLSLPFGLPPRPAFTSHSCRLPLPLSPNCPGVSSCSQTTQHTDGRRDWLTPQAAHQPPRAHRLPSSRQAPHPTSPILSPTVLQQPGTALRPRPRCLILPDAPTLHPPNSPSSSLPCPCRHPYRHLRPHPPPPRLLADSHPPTPPPPLLQDPSMPLHGHPAVPPWSQSYLGLFSSLGPPGTFSIPSLSPCSALLHTPHPLGFCPLAAIPGTSSSPRCALHPSLA